MNVAEVFNGRSVPISTTEDRHSTRDSIDFRGIGLHPNSSTVLDTQKVVHDFETLIPLREVDTADIHTSLVLTLGVVTKESEDGDNGGGCDIESQLVLKHGELLDEFRQALHDVRAILVKLLSSLGVFNESGVWRGWFGERCSGSWKVNRFEVRAWSRPMRFIVYNEPFAD